MLLDLKADLEVEDMKEKEMKSMPEQLKQVQRDQNRITTMLMDLIDLNGQGRNLKWIPPRQPRVGGLVVMHVEPAAAPQS